jgi:hypothetical protein
LIWGYWFQMEDLHHETIIVSCIFTAIILFLTRERKKKK